MSQLLQIGVRKADGSPFTLPYDLVGRKNAIIGQSGCGKTCGVAKIEEELCRVGLPFAALDTVGVHLGLRAKKDGSPSGLPVVVFGGKRGDLPIDEEEIGFGARLAEIVLSSTIPVVIDLSKTYEHSRFRIVAEFCRTLMNNESPDGRHIIVEESPEFIPETIEFKGQDKCRSEMTRLVTLGRNNGYAVTLVGQRWATIRKTCLAQIENFFIMRTIAEDDRKRLRGIFKEIAPEADVSECFNSMAKLKDGEAWFFSPKWLQKFERIQFDERFTFHPGETRKVGVKLGQVNMGDVHKFVAELSKVLSRTMAPVKESVKALKPKMPIWDDSSVRTGRMKTSSPNLSQVSRSESKELRELRAYSTKMADLEEAHRIDAAQAKSQVKSLENGIAQRDEILDGLRKALKPQYDALQKLFGNGDESPVYSGAVDRSKFEGFFKRAGKIGAKGMMEVMLERKRVHKNSLQALANVSKNTYYKGRAWMVKNKIMTLDEGGFFNLNTNI